VQRRDYLRIAAGDLQNTDFLAPWPHGCLPVPSTQDLVATSTYLRESQNILPAVHNGSQLSVSDIRYGCRSEEGRHEYYGASRQCARCLLLAFARSRW
jgi:hypothetical protein